MTDLSLSCGDIIDAVEAYCGSNVTAAAALGYANAGYRAFLYQARDSRTGRIHHWSHLTPLAALTIGGAQTADAACTTAGVVTATAGIFDRSMVGLNMTVTDYDGSNDLVTQITAYSDSNSVVISDTTGFTTCDISVESTGIADLPSDFGGRITEFVYPYSSTELTPHIDEVSPERVLTTWRDNNVVYSSYQFAVVPKPFSSTTGQRYQLWVAPQPDTSTVCLYRYTVHPAPMTDSTANYPLGGPSCAEAVKYAALKEAEIATGQTDGPMARRYQEFLEGSIDQDKDLYETFSVESLADADSGCS